MKKKPQPVAVSILGKEYKIVCSENEKEALLGSAKDLDAQMRGIRDSGTVNTTDRIAVMAALNLMHELRQHQKQETNEPNSIANSLIKLRHKIENVLENS